MKTTKILWLLPAAIFFAACSQQEQKACNDPQSYVEVVGEAEKEIDPDIFYLSITLTEPNNSAKTDIAVLEDKLIEILTGFNIDTKTDLTVTSMSGYNWYWWRNSRDVRQSKTYQLKTNNLEQLNKVCDKLDNMGNINYYLSSTDYSNMDELKKEVQQQAVKQAREKAGNLLAGEDKTTGRLIYLQEMDVNFGMPVYPRYEYNKMAEMADMEAPRVDFKKMKVSYSVVARFSIE